MNADGLIDSYSREDSPTNAYVLSLWKQVPADQHVAILLELLSRYGDLQIEGALDDAEQTLSVALSGLITHGYAVPLQPTESEALAFLRTGSHFYEGLGGVGQPVDIAMGHFRSKLYSDELFDSLGAYRQFIRSMSASSATSVRSDIDFVLWQDFRGEYFWADCWTRGLRMRLGALADHERKHWRWLFQHFIRSTQAKPGRKWIAQAQKDLDAIGRERFVAFTGAWLREPIAAAPHLSGTGASMLKGLIWCTSLLEDRSLDKLWQAVVKIPWKRPFSDTKLVEAIKAVILPLH